MASTDARYHTPAWHALRLMVMDRDRWQCQIRQRGCTTVATTVDHIHPVVEGGEFYDPANLRAACKGCNSRLGLRVAMARSARYRYHTTLAPMATRF